MIKVIDSLGEVHEIDDGLWEKLKALPKCKYRLAEVPIPKEVVEFKPTPAVKNEVEKLIDEKCCDGKCEKHEITVTATAAEIIESVKADTEIAETSKQTVKPANKGGRPKKK